MTKIKKTKVLLNPDNTNNILLKNKISTNYDLKKPVFSLYDIKYLSKHCISNCEKTEKVKIIDKLLKLSQLTWREIQKLPREDGFELLSFKQIRIPLPPNITEEAKLLVFRFSDKGRLAGYRINEILHIVAVDPNHRLY